MAWKVISAGGRFFKELLDTHGRIVALGAIIAACGGGVLVTAVTQAIVNIHGMFLVAVGLLATGVFVVLAGLAVAKTPPAASQGARNEKSSKEKHQEEKLTRDKVFALRNELRAWKESLGPMPELVWESSMGNSAGGAQAFMEKNKPQEQWINKAHYGFIRRFSDKVGNVWLELGELGHPDLILAKALDAPTKGDQEINTIIDRLGQGALLLD